MELRNFGGFSETCIAPDRQVPAAHRVFVKNA